MAKNITLKLSEELLRRCRHAAVEEDKSTSQWVSDVLAKALGERGSHKVRRMNALRIMQDGFELGGSYLSREEAHAR